MEYNDNEKKVLIKKYLTQYQISFDEQIIKLISSKVDSVPREIHNMCIKIRDFVITQKATTSLDKKESESPSSTLSEILRNQFITHSKIDDG